jgi:predicted nucleic acid-binding protein
MRHLFVDTSAWDAIADKGDKNHNLALQFRDEIVGQYKLVTSNYILDELYTLLLINIGFQKTVEFKEKLDILISEYVLQVVWINDDIADRAWKVFEQFNVDKQWSFTPLEKATDSCRWYR